MTNCDHEWATKTTPNGRVRVCRRCGIAAPVADDLIEALVCHEALEHRESYDFPLCWAVLERYGWRREDRFNLPESEFVRQKRRAALASVGAL